MINKASALSTLIFAATFLVGCASPAPVEETPVEETSSEAEEEETTSEPVAKEIPLNKIGESAETTYIKSTLIGFQANWEDPEGDMNQILNVKTCVKEFEGAEPLRISQSPWMIIDSDFGRYTVGGYYEMKETKPIYPPGYDGDPLIAPGECVTGKLPFKTGNKVTAVELRYFATEGEEMRWSLED
jgi:hypothetical protein